MGEDEKLIQEIAQLESLNDYLFTELSEVDRLLKMSGFPDGLESLKETAEEMLYNEDES